MILHQPGGVNVQKRLGFPRALQALLSKACRRGRPVLATMLLVLATLPAAALPILEIKPAASPADQPALWVLSDADTTIYLFGTFHALDERTDWFARNVRAAFDSSDELVLETIVPTDPAELFAMLRRHSLAAPMVVGAPVVGTPVVGSTRGSFAASAGQAMAASRSAGLTVERGADAVLRRIADAQGKPVDGLESFEYQLAMLADLPVAPPPRAAAKARPSDTKRMLLDMRSAWRRGDASSFSAVLVSLEAQSPTTYQRMFVDRNNHWARWIAERMERPGTVFVAVGTGHLIGRDSVQRKLNHHGFTATRIN